MKSPWRKAAYIGPNSRYRPVHKFLKCRTCGKNYKALSRLAEGTEPDSACNSCAVKQARVKSGSAAADQAFREVRRRRTP